MVWYPLTVGTNTSDNRARWRLGYEKDTDTYTISCAAYNAFINGDSSVQPELFMVAPANEYNGSNGYKFNLEKKTSDGYYFIRCVGSDTYITGSNDHPSGLVNGCCFWRGKRKDYFGASWDKRWIFQIKPQDDGTVTIWHQGSGKYLWSNLSPPSCEWYNLPCWGGELARKLFTNPLEFGKDMFTKLVDSASNLVDTANNIFFAPLMEEAVKLIKTDKISNAVSNAITSTMTNNALLKGSPSCADNEKGAKIILILILLFIFLIVLITLIYLR